MKKFVALIPLLLMTEIALTQCEADLKLKNENASLFSLTPIKFEMEAQSQADTIFWSTGDTTSSISVTLHPGEEKQIVLSTATWTNTKDNIIYNGDFEHGYTGFTSDLQYMGYHTEDVRGWFGIALSGDLIYPPLESCTNGNSNIFIGSAFTSKEYTVFSQQVNIEPMTYYRISFVGCNETLQTSLDSAKISHFRIKLGDEYIGSTYTVSNEKCIWRIFKTNHYSGDKCGSMQFRIVNVDAIEEGNNFAIDEIEMNKYCMTYDTLNLSVHAITDTLHIDVCNDRFPVQVGDNFYTKEGLYLHMETDTAYYVLINAHPTYDITMEVTVMDGETYENNGFKESEEGTYTQYLETMFGCDSNVTLNLHIYRSSEIWIPDVFTPANAKNKVFKYFLSNKSDFILETFDIYNKYGTRIFHTDKINVFWDGTYQNQLCEMGTYIYCIHYRWKESPDRVYKKCGEVFLLR